MIIAYKGTDMLINPFTPFHITQNINDKKRNNVQKINFLRTLEADTVSFSGKIPKNPNTFFMDALGRSYDSSEQKFISSAREFHVALKKVSEKLKAYGFSYDEAYNSGNTVKKKHSVMQKYERQGGAQDIIRGTVYWQDQQDISAFKKFIDEMKTEGYEILPQRHVDPNTGDFVRNEKGTIIKFPDLEIRQNGITEDDLSILGEFLQRAEISRPRESGYADWQMRFISVKESGKKEHKQPLELIFKYGPKYAEANDIEHKYVYEITRKFKLLHIDLNPEHHQKNSAGEKIAQNIKQINKRLTQFISQPLFINAYNADLKIKDAEKIPVEISKGYCNLINGYVSSIVKLMPKYYQEMSKGLLSEEQIINAIKNSPEYQIRFNKEITPREIKEKRTQIRSRINDWKEADMLELRGVQKDVKTTIDKFGEK